MKNYLTENLSVEEKAEIIGIIWMVVKNYKYKIQRSKNISLISLDNCNLSCEDSYHFETNRFKDYTCYSHPLSENEKIKIVTELDILMDKLQLTKLERILTFNEKLVFFFSLIEECSNVKASLLLSVSRRTIYNRKESIKAKIDKFRGNFNEQ